MNRRRFLSTLSVSLLAAPVAAGAQRSGKPARMGILAVGPPPSPEELARIMSTSALWQALKDLGWVHGQSIVVERRYGESFDQLRAAAAELVRLSVDVLLAGSAGLATMLQRETKTIPIVVGSAGGELVVGGLITSLARPGGNLTGVQIRNDELIPKKFEFLRALVPNLSRVAFLKEAVTLPVVPQMIAEYDRYAVAAAQSLGLKIHPVIVQRAGEFAAAFGGMTRNRDEGLLVMSTPFAFVHRKGIVDLAAKHRIVAIYENRGFAEAGGLLSYGVNPSEIGRRLAAFLDKILRGAKTGRPAHRAANQIRVRHQPEDRQSPRIDDSAIFAGAGGPPHRMITRRRFLATAGGAILTAVPLAAAAQPVGKVYRVGIIHVSGHHHVVVDGLRQGLRELGLEEGKHFVLDIRKTTADRKAAEEAASDLERGNADLIYTVTSQVTVAARGATVRTPIVFYVGVDPVALGLVESLAKPGGRLTGVHGLARDVTAKRLAVLKEMIPRLRRVITFYNPDEPVSKENARLGRDAARQLGVQIVERHVGSIEDLRLSLQGLKSREVDAYFHTPGSLQTSQALPIIEATRGKKLPTMFHELSLVAKGALASYGISYQEIGRVSAKHVQRILAGNHPKDLPVENYDKVGLALNLRIAREIGLTIPPSLRLQADQVIE